MSSPILTTAALPSSLDGSDPRRSIGRPLCRDASPAERAIKRQSGNFQSAHSGRIHPVLTGAEHGLSLVVARVDNDRAEEVGQVMERQPIVDIETLVEQWASQ